MAGVKKILLAEMAEFRPDFLGDGQVIVDDESDIGAARSPENLFRHAADFFRRRLFCAELDQIRATVAKLLHDNFRRAAVQVSRVHKRVKPAFRKQFHNRRSCSRNLQVAQSQAEACGYKAEPTAFL